MTDDFEADMAELYRLTDEILTACTRLSGEDVEAALGTHAAR